MVEKMMGRSGVDNKTKKEETVLNHSGAFELMQYYL